MKKISFLLTILMVSVFSMNAFSQSSPAPAPADFFAGKWNVVIKNTPQGDAKLVFNFTKKDGALSGVVTDSAGTEISKMSNLEVKENEVTVSFSAQGFDLTITLTKKDEDHLTGMLMNMFEVEAIRIKEEKK
ncbi:MAG: hypothetical protein K2P88_13040 [Chitinophagaceae bacterium]|uniref:hypothetical protein n=1 Tax=unclassified Paraflavitalea TaxID=2798305 RepID=UPI003D3507C5|nr:hypothetical protein [Chitinophagaceae bacterium]